MDTDDLFDQRLADAGASWRAANTEASDVDLHAARPPRRRRRVLAAGLAVAAVVAVAAGLAVGHAERGNGRSPVGAAGPDRVNGVHWVLAKVDGRRVDRPGGTLYVHGPTITFNDTCNTGSGAVHVQDTALVIGDIAMTAIGCPAAQSFEKVDQILTGTVHWSVTSGVLTITKGRAGTLTYIRDIDPGFFGQPAIAGTTWVLWMIDVSTANSVSGTAAGGVESDKITIHGTAITIAHRCYVNTGVVQVGDSTLDIAGVHVTGTVPCPATSDQQGEQARNTLTDGVLSGHATWQIHDGMLFITKGGTVLYFHPDDSQPSAGNSNSAAAAQAYLITAAWRLSSIEHSSSSSGSASGSASGSPTMSAITLSLDGNGHYALGACGDVKGSVVISPGSLELTPPRTTPSINCAGTDRELGGDASTARHVLSGRVTWSVGPGRLSITKGDTSLQFDAG